MSNGVANETLRKELIFTWLNNATNPTAALLGEAENVRSLISVVLPLPISFVEFPHVFSSTEPLSVRIFLTLPYFVRRICGQQS